MPSTGLSSGAGEGGGGGGGGAGLLPFSSPLRGSGSLMLRGREDVGVRLKVLLLGKARWDADGGILSVH